MELEVKVEGNLQAELETLGSAVQDAANAAVLRQGRETQGAMQAHVEQRLSRRAAGTITHKEFVNTEPGKGPVGSVTYYIHSRWWRRPVGGGEQIDLLSAFERGATIVPAHGGALAVPLPAAYNVVGLSAGYRRARKAPTPQAVEIALGGQPLFFLRTRRGDGLLCAKDVSVSSGRHRRIRSAAYTSKKGRAVRRKGLTKVVPMFVLLKNTHLPKRLDFGPIREAAARGLADKLVVELATRGVTE